MKNTPGLLLIVLYSFVLFKCAKEEQVIPPNILFIYTDDQAPWGIGVNGNEQIHTPNMDQLAAEGAYFTNSFVTTPVCSPARVSLMTSQYATEHGVLDFIPQIGHRLYNPDQEIGLNPESTTFPEVLQSAGYTTGLVGKWHTGIWTPEGPKTYHPTNNGYDYFMGLIGGGTSPEDPVLEKDGVAQPFSGLTTDILTDHAIEFIKDKKEEPFLLSLHYRAPHAKWLPVADEDWKHYEDLDPTIPNPDYPDLDIEKVKRKMNEYMASISGVDRNIGRVLQLLKELGIENNTVVIFSSDHGYNMGHNGIEHKGNGYWITKTRPPAVGNLAENSRPNMYDNSLKVPAIIRWPGVVAPGMVIHQVMTSLDWYPTVVEMAGAALPEEHIVRGRSLMPLIKGEKTDWDNEVYAEYSMINYSRAYMRTYRTPKWKLTIDFMDQGRNELYHLEEDPLEEKNLFDSNLDDANLIITKLTERILEKMKLINDPLLEQISELDIQQD